MKTARVLVYIYLKKNMILTYKIGKLLTHTKHCL
uniref:Uncharacterized protein n=1 Tax=Anguilla anguilla TaxID=7936 RepID=A0A0E9RZX1_ANGAN